MKRTLDFPAGPQTQYELDQLSMFSDVSKIAQRTIEARNQLGIIFANGQLEYTLRLVPNVSIELDEAQQIALAAEAAGQPSYRFPW